MPWLERWRPQEIVQASFETFPGLLPGLDSERDRSETNISGGSKRTHFWPAVAGSCKGRCRGCLHMCGKI